MNASKDHASARAKAIMRNSLVQESKLGCSVRAPTRPALVAMSVQPAPSENVLRPAPASLTAVSRWLHAPDKYTEYREPSTIEYRAPRWHQREESDARRCRPALRRHGARHPAGAAGRLCRLRHRVRRRLTAEGGRYFTHQISPAYQPMFPAALMQPLPNLQLSLPCVERARLPRSLCVP